MYGKRLATLLVALAMLAGCQAAQPEKRPVAEYQAVGLTEAPADLAAFYEQMKAVAGLYVLTRGDQTYLLLTGGKVEQPGMRVEVFDVQNQFGGSKQVRILAALRPGAGAGPYPFAVVQIPATKDATYIARLSQPDGQVVELTGMPINDR